MLLRILGFLIALSGFILIHYQSGQEYHVYQGTAYPSEAAMTSIRANEDSKRIQQTAEGGWYIDLKTKHEYPELKSIEQPYRYSFFDSKLGLILIVLGAMFIVGGFAPKHPAIEKYNRDNPPDIYY